MTSDRLRLIDTIRGFSVISMVLFHLSYDLYFLRDVPLSFFEPPLRDIWRASISWTFLLIAGLMCAQSRDNLRRAARYGAVALAIYVVTTVAAFDDPINFGIIYCMAFSTLCAWVLERLGVFTSHNLEQALVLVALFLICLPAASGFIGIGNWQVALPAQLYSTPWLSWLGFPGPGFISSDYYPPIPFTLLYLAGAHIGFYLKQYGGYPSWAHTLGIRPLEFVGRHALEVYVLHQPLIFALLALFN